MGYSRERGQGVAVSQAVVLEFGGVAGKLPISRSPPGDQKFPRFCIQLGGSYSLLNTFLRKWKWIALKLILGKQLMLR